MSGDVKCSIRPFQRELMDLMEKRWREERKNFVVFASTPRDRDPFYELWQEAHMKPTTKCCNVIGAGHAADCPTVHADLARRIAEESAGLPARYLTPPKCICCMVGGAHARYCPETNATPASAVVKQHYDEFTKQLVGQMERMVGLPAPCCGTRGGHHSFDCPKFGEKPPVASTINPLCGRVGCTKTNYHDHAAPLGNAEFVAGWQPTHDAGCGWMPGAKCRTCNAKPKGYGAVSKEMEAATAILQRERKEWDKERGELKSMVNNANRVTTERGESLRAALCLVLELAIESGRDLDGPNRWCRACKTYLTRANREYPHKDDCRAKAVLADG